MNLPNKLTLIRILLAIAIIPILMLNQELKELTALSIFVVASLTDFLDGYIARKYKLITNLGKFLDPLADKILVMSTLICFIELGWVRAWIVVVILIREFAVTGIRLAAVSSSTSEVIAASMLGKIKTASTMIAIIAVFVLHTWGFGISVETTFLITDIFMYVTVFLTVVSGAEYIYKYRGVLNQ